MMIGLRKPLRLLLALLFCLALGAALPAAPRLWPAGANPAMLRERIADKDSPRSEIYRLLRARVDAPETWWDPASKNWNYGRAYLATSAAFLYQITGERQYARIAYRNLRAIYDDPDPDRRLPNEGYGLGRATVGLGFAYAWDWARDGWSAEEQAWVRERMEEALAAWKTYRHANLEAEHRGSNWVSVCHGGELILMLAIEAEKSDPDRYAFLKDSLLRHMQNFDELGVSQEGIGYTGYGGIFLLRALLALRAVGDSGLEGEAARHEWWRQAMYAGSFSLNKASTGRLWLQSGVSGTGIGDEGWASLLFAFTPTKQLPYYRWWYDRHLGPLAEGPASLRYDPRRDGQVWAMLLYPEAVEPADPTGVFPTGVKGEAGLVLLRNRWKGRADIQVSVHADSRHHSHAWDQPEVFDVRVLAHGEVWIGGPGKETAPEGFSTLLVDGRNAREKVGVGDNGILRRAEFWPDGGYVVVDGGEQYRQIGLIRAERHVLVHFTRESDDLLLSVLDVAQAAETHEFAVQWNLGEPGEPRPVRRDRRFVAKPGLPFVAMGGGWPVCSLMGLVRAPGEAVVRYADPVLVKAEGSSVSLWTELSIRCVGGETGESYIEIVEKPRLPGVVERSEDGGLRLVRPASAKPARGRPRP